MHGVAPGGNLITAPRSPNTREQIDDIAARGRRMSTTPLEDIIGRMITDGPLPKATALDLARILVRLQWFNRSILESSLLRDILPQALRDEGMTPEDLRSKG